MSGHDDLPEAQRVDHPGEPGGEVPAAVGGRAWPRAPAVPSPVEGQDAEAARQMRRHRVPPVGVGDGAVEG